MGAGVMRAFEVVAQDRGAVMEVPPPEARPGEAVVEVAYAGICGTDIGLFGADDERLLELRAHRPLRPGHEWSGTVAAVGAGADSAWVGRRVTGETIIGCGHCEDCRAGLPNLCAERLEIGVRGGRPGAFAERVAVPLELLHDLPESVDLMAGALVEPAANAWRAVAAAAVAPGVRLLVLGSGTIGLLCAQFATAAGGEVHVLGLDEASLALAHDLGVTATWHADDLPPLLWDVVIDATDGPSMPAYALEIVRAGGTVVLIGVAHRPSDLDSRRIVRMELSVRGILGGSQGFGPAIEAFAVGAVRPHPLVGAIIGLDGIEAGLTGRKPTGCGPGPKLLVDPRR